MNKFKGKAGELAVAIDLLSNEMPVFLEYGDLSKIDLITRYNDKLITIQVKTTTSKNDTAILNLRKMGRWKEYHYVYKDTDFDYFALFVEDKNVILYIKSSEALRDNRAICTFRFRGAKNNQKKKIRYAKNYVGVAQFGRAGV